MNNMPPIRLLMATLEPFPSFRVDVAALFGKYLPRLGVMSDIVAARTPGSAGGESWGGGAPLVISTRGGRPGKVLLTFAHGAYRLLSADRNAYSAIQVRDMPLMALVGLAAARWKGLRFFYWMSYPIFEGQIQIAWERGLSSGVFWFVYPWFRGHLGRLLLYRVVMPRADHVFVQSEKMREAVGGEGIPMEKMTPVVMGVDLEQTKPELVPPSNDPRLAGRRVLVYLGAMNRNRRIDFLFEMLPFVRNEFSDVLLVLVGSAGDEPYQRWLERRAEQLGVADSILWTGFLPIREAWRYVRAAEVGLSPIPRGTILDSGSPTKCFEYMALGVPVVGNDNPDQKRALEEGEAGLCVPMTAEGFAGAVRRLLADESLRRAMGSAGRRYVEARRGYDVLSRAVAEKYAELLK